MEPIILTCNNKKVLSFYNEHPNMDFETMNIIFVDIMETLSQDMTSFSDNIASQILTNIKGLQTQIITVTDTVNKMHSEVINNFSIKLNDFKKDYFEDIKMILTNNTSEKIAPLIKEFQSIMYDKTFIMINEVLPKNNDLLTKHMKEFMTSFHYSISTDTNNLLKNAIDKQSLETYINNLDGKFSNAIYNSQQIINSSITNSEQRIDTRINEIKNSTEKHIIDIKAISTTNQDSQGILHNSVSDLLKKMENPAHKGKYSENILFNILQSLYLTAQIDVVGEQKETGDIILTRKNKPKILIENKNWNKNAPQEEVKKFIRDVETQNCCGLFLSQNFGIANKENFEININDGHILLYVHETNNDAEKIKIAIDIIDNFKIKLDEIICSNGDGYNIDKEILDEINKEYQLFATQKMIQLKTVKDFSVKMSKQIEDMQLPSLEHYLCTKYAFSTSKYVCEFCEYVAKNQSAMSAHKRGCKSKGTMFLELDQTEDLIENIIIDIVEPVINNPVPTSNNKKDKLTKTKTKTKL
jgi:hypothetical protein